MECWADCRPSIQKGFTMRGCLTGGVGLSCGGGTYRTSAIRQSAPAHSLRARRSRDSPPHPPPPLLGAPTCLACAGAHLTPAPSTARRGLPHPSPSAGPTASDAPKIKKRKRNETGSPRMALPAPGMGSSQRVRPSAPSPRPGYLGFPSEATWPPLTAATTSSLPSEHSRAGRKRRRGSSSV